MPNQIDGNGIQIQDLSEILTDISEGTAEVLGLKQIFGEDINLDSNSPDGQMMNIFALSKKDILDLIVEDYNSKDPDQAVGVALDGLCQLCGISRKGGTYTEVAVTIQVDRSVTLDGLDTSTTPYTISDSNDNQFQLITTTALTTGTTSCNFRSSEIGAVQVLAGTITTPVTVVLGVTSVNNPAVAYQNGADQETDALLRVRRQNSTARPGEGYLSSLYGALVDIEEVIDVLIRENNTNDDPDALDIPAHSIWVIVDGGTDEDIGAAIYAWRNAGCGMKGSEEVVITQIDSTSFSVFFDRPIEEDLYIELTLVSKSSSTIDEDEVKNYILANYVPKIGESVDMTSISTLVRELNSDLIVTSCQVSDDDITYVDLLAPTTLQHKFILDLTRITTTV